MKRLGNIWAILAILALFSCEVEDLAPAFEFDAGKYAFDVVEVTPLGCSRIPDEVLIFYNGAGINLNDATALQDGDHLNVINASQTRAVRIPQATFYRYMTEQYSDSAVMEFGQLIVYIKKQ